MVTWVWQPRGVPQALESSPESAHAFVIFTPGCLERMFEDGGAPAGDSAEPSQLERDPDAAAAFAKKFGFEVVGPQLA